MRSVSLSLERTALEQQVEGLEKAHYEEKERQEEDTGRRLEQKDQVSQVLGLRHSSPSHGSRPSPQGENLGESLEPRLLIPCHLMTGHADYYM